jgi:hypothetical protein
MTESSVSVAPKSRRSQSVRDWLYQVFAVATPMPTFFLQARRLLGYVHNVFGFNCGVELLFTSFGGEPHGRFISVIGE